MTTRKQLSSFSFRSVNFETLEHRRILAVLADIDADGDLDATSPSAWHENVDGLGTFSRHFVTAASTVSLTGDMDGDGDLDFVTNELKWYENTNGKGDFSVQHAIANGDGSIKRLKVTDIGNDGDQDIIAFAGARITLYENSDSRGTFLARPFIEFAGARDADDVNGDGHLDVLTNDERTPLPGQPPTTHFTSIHINDGNNSFVRTDLAGGNPGHGVPVGFALVDINSDLQVDVAVSSGDGLSRLVYWFKNSGQGTFLRSEFRAYVDGALQSVVITDLDRDGDLDIAWAGRMIYSGLYWSLNDGSESFVPAAQVFAFSDYQFIDAGDINNDGTPDFLKNVTGTPEWFDGADVVFSAKDALSRNGQLAIDIFQRQLRSPKRLASLDLDADGQVNKTDFDYLLRFILDSTYGDANLDKVFDSKDLVAVFQAAEYEDASLGNSTWREGDWNADGDFTSRDLVDVFQDGSFEPMELLISGPENRIVKVTSSIQKLNGGATIDSNAANLIDGDVSTYVDAFSRSDIWYSSYSFRLDKEYKLNAIRIWYDRLAAFKNTQISFDLNFYDSDSRFIGRFSTPCCDTIWSGSTLPQSFEFPIPGSVAQIDVVISSFRNSASRIHEIEFLGLPS